MKTDASFLWEEEWRLERRRTLIVDDDRAFTDSLSILLEEWQWAVKVVANAKEALGAIDVFQPEIVMIDMSTGRDSSIDLVMTLKAHYPDLIAIMIAGDVEVSMAIDALRSGCDDFFSKPVQPDELSAALERSLAKLAVIRQKQAVEEALYDSELRYRQLVETTPDSIFVQAGGTIMFLNPTAVELLGFDVSDDALGKRLVDFVHAEDVEDFVAASDAVESTWLPRQLSSLRIIRSNGEVRYVEPYAAPIDYRGWPAQLVVMRDVSGSRRAEEQLRQAQKLEAISHLTAGIAHDFNNLLAVIIGNLQLMKRINGGQVLSTSADPGEIADAAIDAARRGAKMVENLLAFARNKPLTMVATDVNEFIRKSLDMISQSFDHRIALHTDLRASPALVTVDQTQLLNAVLNLIVNARNAMPDGGTVTISTDNVRHRIDSQPGEAGDFVRLSVTDSGVGMNEEVRQRAFDPFYSTREEGDGTGLGLSMVLAFAKQSNGDATIESAPGKGTTVAICLPPRDDDANDHC